MKLDVDVILASSRVNPDRRRYHFNNRQSREGRQVVPKKHGPRREVTHHWLSLAVKDFFLQNPKDNLPIGHRTLFIVSEMALCPFNKTLKKASLNVYIVIQARRELFRRMLYTEKYYFRYTQSTWVMV
jgi:hypothetical protein